MRNEHDFLGTKKIPSDAYYGIHSFRAKENFQNETRFQLEWYKSMGLVKLACYQTYLGFRKALLKKYGELPPKIPLMEEKVIDSLCLAATKVSTGELFNHFIVPAIQGGAGTSINMNINEIIANLALEHQGKPKGSYSIIDPVEHANIFQSTNDVVPTALRLASMQLLSLLEEKINLLRFKLEELERGYRDTLRIGYTQLQEAVPTSYGKFFGAFNEAFSRDWWRVSKAFERIKVVNLGGSAVGTGITVPTYFIMEVVPMLRKLVNLPLTRSENLPDSTSNLDSFVEVHAILKSHAVNLEKFVNDIRLLSSDFARQGEIFIPQLQAGSSIMPGKVNPVITEYIVSAVQKIYANDSIITSLAGMGQLELNAYIPSIGHALLESIKLLIGSNQALTDNLISGLKVNKAVAYDKLKYSPAITTALVPHIGYNKSSEVALLMKKNRYSIFKAVEELGFMGKEKLDNLLKPDVLLKLGFQLKDLE